MLDLFLGSGDHVDCLREDGASVLRVELDPLYVDIARMRWEAFTGEKAKRVEAEVGLLA